MTRIRRLKKEEEFEQEGNDTPKTRTAKEEYKEAFMIMLENKRKEGYALAQKEDIEFLEKAIELYELNWKNGIIMSPSEIKDNFKERIAKLREQKIQWKREEIIRKEAFTDIEKEIDKLKREGHNSTGFYTELKQFIRSQLLKSTNEQISSSYLSPQEHLGDKGNAMSRPSSVAKKSDYSGMSESKQKHTPVDSRKGCKCRIKHFFNLSDSEVQND